jgi:hypothetical protein
MIIIGLLLIVYASYYQTIGARPYGIGATEPGQVGYVVQRIRLPNGNCSGLSYSYSFLAMV